MDVSSVASLGTALSNAKLGNAIGTAVAVKVQDSQKQQGAAALQLLQAASNVGPGDALSAAATGLGGQIDVAA